MIRALLLLAPLLLLPACGADGEPQVPASVSGPAQDVISSGTISSGDSDGNRIDEDSIDAGNISPG